MKDYTPKFSPSGVEVNIMPVIDTKSAMQFDAKDLPDVLPILTLRNAVIFPGTVYPVTVGRERSIKLVQEVEASDGLIGAVPQTDITVEDPKIGDLSRYGTVAKLVKTIEMPDNTITAIIQGVKRFDIKKIDNDDVERALIEKRGIGADDAHRIARLANGNWLKALDELQVGSENELFLDMYIMLMRLAYQRKIKDLRKWSEQMAGMGREKQKRWLTFFLRMTRENFMYNFQDEELVYMTQREEDFAKNFARFVNENNVLPISDLTNLAIRDIGQNANGKIVFFDFALQMIVLLLQK